MIEMTLPDISCGHCASAVTLTCKQVDPQAEVEVDVSTKTVKIRSVEGRSDFVEALAEAGYPPAE